MPHELQTILNSCMFIVQSWSGEENLEKKKSEWEFTPAEGATEEPSFRIHIVQVYSNCRKYTSEYILSRYNPTEGYILQNTYCPGILQLKEIYFRIHIVQVYSK